MKLVNVLCKFAVLVPVLSIGCAALPDSNDPSGGQDPVGHTVIAQPPKRPVGPAVRAPEQARAAWRNFLGQQREKQIERLQAYATEGRFAMNSSEPGLAFVWRDEQGRLCAMADLVNASGRSDLVDAVAREDNDLQLASVQDGEMYEWMLRSGLTQEEIQLVQEPGFVGRQMGGDVPVAVTSWEIERKRDHLRSVVELLRLDAAASIEVALDRLGDRVLSTPS